MNECTHSAIHIKYVYTQHPNTRIRERDTHIYFVLFGNHFSLFIFWRDAVFIVGCDRVFLCVFAYYMHGCVRVCVCVCILFLFVYAGEFAVEHNGCK